MSDALPIATERHVNYERGEVLMGALAASERDAHWYALWTRSRHETVVSQQLKEKRLEAFLPTITRWSRWKDRRKKIDWPLFPGYCFARFTLHDRLAVLKCAGVVNIVSAAGVPATIPDEEIDGIRLLMTTQVQYDPCPLVPNGARVEVVCGPLRGVVGHLLRKELKRATVVLSVDLIGRGVRLELDAADIRPC
jgi:transcriptional antiterminator NusG